MLNSTNTHKFSVSLLASLSVIVVKNDSVAYIIPLSLFSLLPIQLEEPIRIYANVVIIRFMYQFWRSKKKHPQKIETKAKTLDMNREREKNRTCADRFFICDSRILNLTDEQISVFFLMNCKEFNDKKAAWNLLPDSTLSLQKFYTFYDVVRVSKFFSVGFLINKY